MQSKKRRRFDLHSLSTRIFISLVVLVSLATLAVALPALGLTHRQLGQQSWAQVTQGSRATRVLFADRRRELTDMATLVVQRPTFQVLWAAQDRQALADYLEPLREGVAVDFIVICDAAGVLARASGAETFADSACRYAAEAPSHDIFYLDDASGDASLWMLARAPIAAENYVLLGRHLDAAFALVLREQTGLEHTLLLRRRVLASSLALDAQQQARLALIGPAAAADDAAANRAEVSFAGTPYYLLRVPLPGDELAGELVDVIALDVGSMTLARRHLALALGASVIGIALLGSALGLLVARQMGAPLSRLAQIATRLLQGEYFVTEPGMEEFGVRELVLVARALSETRGDMLRVLAELQQEKDWVDHLLEAIVEGIMTLDAGGHITFFSLGAARIVGCAREAALGRACDDLFVSVDADSSFLDSLPPEGGNCKIEVTLPDGRQVLLSVTGSRMLPPGADDIQVALVFRDVSDEELGHRFMAHFMANVTHEFHTPLAALAASVELLVDQAPYLEPAELQHLLGSLHLSVLRLQTLVSNLLEGAGIECGRFRVYVQSANLSEIVVEALHMVQPLLYKRHQHLILDFPERLPPVRADFRRTVQVLTNLLGNACKYSPADTSVTIRARLTDSLLRVEVVDCGPGIATSQQESLFRNFARGGSDQEKAQAGVGLGLAVSKAIVEAQGGDIGVQSALSGGACFWFTLVIAESKEQSE